MLSKEQSMELYKKLFLIRASENLIIEEYPNDEMKTPMHMSMGAEAIAVGICQCLSKEDQVFTSYRSHAVYLAKTDNVDDFFAEMYGKETALLKGKGGSMHLCDPANGFMGASGIVASAISVACGAAFANKVMVNGKVVVIFLGDGATEEGEFWESLNIACLWRLPIVFVCEDNGLAVHTNKNQRKGYRYIVEIVEKYNCKTLEISSTNVEVIYTFARENIEDVRKGGMPLFIYTKYFRYLEHVGIHRDYEAPYRSNKSNIAIWLELDPIDIQRNKIALDCTETEIIKEEMAINSRIRESITSAKQAQSCDWHELYRGVDETNNLL